jgi:hypothetical protein
MLVELIDVDDARWKRALHRISHDVYHSSEYARVEAGRLGGRASAFYGIDERGTEYLAPVLIRPLPLRLQLPDSWRDAIAPYGYPAPICSAGGSNALNEFLQCAVQVARENGIISLFLRWHPMMAPAGRQPIAGESLVDHGSTVFIDLTESRDQWHQQTRSDHRYQIGRLRKLGFQFVIDDWTQLPEFHRVYVSTMERVAADAMYHFSLRYFQELQESLGSLLHLASVISPDGETAASGLFTECCGIVQYHLSGSDGRFLRLAPMKLLLDHIRHWAKDRGNHTFHLGGGVGGQNDALFQFKAAFSKHSARFQTSRIITDFHRYQKAVIAAEIGPLSPQNNYFPTYRKAA